MRNKLLCLLLAVALTALTGCSLARPEQEAAALIRQMRERHGATDCATLLKASHDRGEVRKEHCDGLVYEMVALLEQILSRRDAG